MDSSKKRVGLYARVSTLHKGQDVELQLAELREFAAARGWSVQDEYFDEGVSGVKDRRPALDKLLGDCRQRKLDIVAVWKLDRWGRSLQHVITTLNELQQLGVSFVSLRDSFDLTTAAGRAMLGMVAVMAEFERSLIRERVAAGMRRAVQKGKRLGAPVKAFPQAQVERLLKAGHSMSEISRRTGVSRPTIIRKLAAAGGLLEAKAAPMVSGLSQ